jgi:hypothetical protein
MLGFTWKCLPQICLALLYAASITPEPAAAQGMFPTATQITKDSTQSGTRVNDVYSPRMIRQTINGTSTLVMYFGGWYQTSSSSTPNDAIYRVVCSAPNVCGTPQMVINPVAFGLGSASLANNPTIVEVNANGQNIYIMYMTVVTGNVVGAGFTTSNNQIYYSTSFATDGVNWSTPQLLIPGAWLPSATLDNNNPPNVILYANGNGAKNSSGQEVPFLARYNLGPSGVAVNTPVAVNTGNTSYDNVEVRFRTTTNPVGYQMLGQQLTSNVNSEIDYLFSTDGINFELSSSNIVQNSQTPAAHPDTSCWVYYGLSGGTLDSNIFFQSWC